MAHFSEPRLRTLQEKLNTLLVLSDTEARAVAEKYHIERDEATDYDHAINAIEEAEGYTKNPGKNYTGNIVFYGPNATPSPVSAMAKYGVIKPHAILLQPPTPHDLMASFDEAATSSGIISIARIKFDQFDNAKLSHLAKQAEKLTFVKKLLCAALHEHAGRDGNGDGPEVELVLTPPPSHFTVQSHINLKGGSWDHVTLKDALTKNGIACEYRDSGQNKGTLVVTDTNDRKIALKMLTVFFALSGFDTRQEKITTLSAMAAQLGHEAFIAGPRPTSATTQTANYKTERLTVYTLRQLVPNCYGYAYDRSKGKAYFGFSSERGGCTIDDFRYFGDMRDNLRHNRDRTRVSVEYPPTNTAQSIGDCMGIYLFRNQKKIGHSPKVLLQAIATGLSLQATFNPGRIAGDTPGLPWMGR